MLQYLGMARRHGLFFPRYTHSLSLNNQRPYFLPLGGTLVSSFESAVTGRMWLYSSIGVSACAGSPPIKGVACAEKLGSTLTWLRGHQAGWMMSVWELWELEDAVSLRIGAIV